MARALNRVGDGLGRHCRLLGNRSTLTMLAITTPGGYLGTRQGQTKWLAIKRLVALIPGWARLWMASKMGRLKLAGTRGRNTPDRVSTIMDVPCNSTTAT
jgi:hypothetical protein